MKQLKIIVRQSIYLIVLLLLICQIAHSRKIYSNEPTDSTKQGNTYLHDEEIIIDLGLAKGEEGWRNYNACDSFKTMLLGVIDSLVLDNINLNQALREKPKVEYKTDWFTVTVVVAVIQLLQFTLYLLL